MDRNEMLEQIIARVAEKLVLAGEAVSGSEEVLGRQPDPALPGLLILTQGHGTDCHSLLESSRIKERYHTCCALLAENQVELEGVEAVVLFDLTIDAMCKIASGILDTPYTELAGKALLLGKKLYVPKEAVELNQYPAGNLGSYQCMLQAKLTKLVSWGLKICPMDQLEDRILGEAPEAAEKAVQEQPGKEACKAAAEAAKKEAPCEKAAEEKEIVFTKRVISERDIIEANRDNVKVIRITERNILTALAKDAASARNIRLIRE